MADKLYKFHWDCGRMGAIDGLFVADDEAVSQAIGKTVDFGEALGKHSDISAVLEESDLVIKSDDLDFIAKLIEVIGGRDISGYNPLQYISD